MATYIIFKSSIDLHPLFRIGLLLVLILMPFTKHILLMYCLYSELQNLLYLHVCPGLSITGD